MTHQFSNSQYRSRRQSMIASAYLIDQSSRALSVAIGDRSTPGGGEASLTFAVAQSLNRRRTMVPRKQHRKPSGVLVSGRRWFDLTKVKRVAADLAHIALARSRNVVVFAFDAQRDLASAQTLSITNMSCKQPDEWDLMEQRRCCLIALPRSRAANGLQYVAQVDVVPQGGARRT